MPDIKSVKEFWNAASCGESLYLKDHSAESYRKQAEIRYRLEPEILEFAQFHRYKGKKILEIGLGCGADHEQFANAGAETYGVDLTPRAVAHVERRLKAIGLRSNVQVGDAENLPFDEGAFDLVYSWGVLHVTPDTEKAIQEVYRVLKPGGEARIMIYHTYSFVGYMLWIRYALMRARPFTSLSKIYFDYLESTGTKAYTPEETRQLFRKFKNVTIDTALCHGDLLTSDVGQRHRGVLLTIARKMWPRWLIRTLFPKHGLFLTTHAYK